MRKKKLRYFVDVPKTQKLKRIVIISLALMLVITLLANFSTFSRAVNKMNYDKYLASLYRLKEEQGISALSEINSDFAGWISCKDVDIELPFVKVHSVSEESYYLDHDFEKNQNELGAPYQKYGTVVGQTSNAVLVGHSAYTQSFFNVSKNQSIFGKFSQYLIENNSFDYSITIQTIDDVFDYKVIGVVLLKADDVSSEKYRIYRTTNINNQSEFDKFYGSVKNNSTVKNLDTATYGDKFLTLFTCWVNNLDYRVMVVAKQI